MPITGLPDPAIHRKCKRCGGWFHLHEGALGWPPKRGLISVVHVTMVESTGIEREMKFFCTACGERNAIDEQRFKRAAIHTAVAMLLIALAIPLASWLGVSTWLQDLLR